MYECFTSKGKHACDLHVTYMWYLLVVQLVTQKRVFSLMAVREAERAGWMTLIQAAITARPEAAGK